MSNWKKIGYEDIKKLHMEHSKLLFAVFKLYERKLISDNVKISLKCMINFSSRMLPRKYSLKNATIVITYFHRMNYKRRRETI